MKITAISDMHGYLPEIEQTDLLLICGDFSPLEIQTKIERMKLWMEVYLIPWFMKIPAEKIVFIAGNHDFICDSSFLFYDVPGITGIDFNNEILKPLLRKNKIENKVCYLCNSSTKFKGLKIYGCPYVEGCRRWAFSQAEMRDVYDNIPKCDILITHQPPLYKNIGRTFINNVEWEFGSEGLLKVIQKRKPRYLFCGHIHDGDHIEYIYKHPDGLITEMHNCTIKNEDYRPFYPPTIVENTL